MIKIGGYRKSNGSGFGCHGLEKTVRIFPMLGKTRLKSSKGWKNQCKERIYENTKNAGGDH